jgi:CxxC motif-containing protein (DUF1111 family)
LNAYFVNTTAEKTILAHPAGSMTEEAEARFLLGKSFFRIPWVEAPSATTARDGLGPLFNANTCIHCHPHNGAGRVFKEDGTLHRSLLLRLAKPKAENDAERETLHKNGFVPDPVYGAQLSLHAIAPVKPEGTPVVSYKAATFTYPDGTTATLHTPVYSVENLGYGPLHKETTLSARIAPSLIGLGHLTAIPAADILAREDPADKDHDGISGKAQWVYSPETNQKELGRFTWKGSAATPKQQAAAAFHHDMGLSNPIYPQPNCTAAQRECNERAALSAHELDVPQERLDAVAAYITNLKIPLPKKIDAKGKQLFETVGCAACHVPQHVTDQGVVIRPYTDLLLHDMGEGLADGRSEFLAGGREWRTAPLWGIGLKKQTAGAAHYLHDGRARTIEAAILWHGGEAQQARNAFAALPKAARQSLLHFLESL